MAIELISESIKIKGRKGERESEREIGTASPHALLVAWVQDLKSIRQRNFIRGGIAMPICPQLKYKRQKEFFRGGTWGKSTFCC